MHARMNTSLSTRRGQHDRLMCSQAAARQWSLHTMITCGFTSRGQLHLMVVHAVVQRLASVCRMCGPRSIAISTSLIACAARVVRGRPLRLPRASLGSVWVVLALINRWFEYCGRCGGGRALAGGIHNDIKVATEIFVFLAIWRRNASAVGPAIAQQRRVVHTLPHMRAPDI